MRACVRKCVLLRRRSRPVRLVRSVCARLAACDLPLQILQTAAPGKRKQGNKRAIRRHQGGIMEKGRSGHDGWLASRWRPATTPWATRDFWPRDIKTRAKTQTGPPYPASAVALPCPFLASTDCPTPGEMLSCKGQPPAQSCMHAKHRCMDGAPPKRRHGTRQYRGLAPCVCGSHAGPLPGTLRVCMCRECGASACANGRGGKRRAGNLSASTQDRTNRCARKHGRTGQRGRR